MLSDKRKISLNIWGESHGEAIGMTLTGIKSGIAIDLDKLQLFVDRRKSRKSAYSTTRYEPDKIIITGGIVNGVTTGETIEAKIINTSQKSSDYASIKFTPRPSHADYPAFVKYNGTYDMSGGGKFSGRLTAPMCIAGGIAEQILEQQGITVGAYISEIANISGTSYRTKNLTCEDIDRVKQFEFPVIDEASAVLMLAEIEKAREDSDSVGGIVECIAFSVPTGIGETMFDSIESKLSALLFGIPAVKGVEFGTGFDITKLRGSQANDCYYYDCGKVKTLTNNNGGILGGLSTGMPITVRVAFKPTPSIAKPQKTVDLIKQEDTVIEIKGRHDACIVPRAVVVVEAAMALAILDSMN